MKKTVEEVRNDVSCAQINLDNLIAMVPLLKTHPILQIVQYQLECAMTDDESEIKLGKAND